MAKGRGRKCQRPITTLVPRQIDIDKVSDQEIQDIVITANLTPRKCLGFKFLFRQSSKSLAKTCKSGSRKALLHLALKSRGRLPLPAKGRCALSKFHSPRLSRLEVQDFNSDAATIAIRKSKSGKPRHVVLTPEGAVAPRNSLAF